MKRIMVVGASSGIGEALAQLLIVQGFSIVSLSRSPPAFEVETHVNYDVRADTEPSGIDGTLNGLVYCPGSLLLKPFKLTKLSEFKNDLQVNFLGAVRVLQHYLPALSGSGDASVVLFSTIAAGVGMPYHSSIAASKGAVEGLVRSLAAEWAPVIRVNAIAPSLVQTSLTTRLTDSETKLKTAADRHPLKRIGSTADIAAIAAFLLTPQASWITGQILHVDGGLSTLKK
jgi:3-oxoacyl-[acyl-carrier protein] reductase